MFKHKLLFVLVPAFMAVFAVGFLVGGKNNNAYAQETCTVDRALLTRIYKAIFHRDVDAGGAVFHTGRTLDAVLTDIENSDEHVNYSAVFKATKALEEAKRSRQLTAADEERYKKFINSALSHVSAWSETLPQQAIDKAVVGPDQAREAIRRAYERMNATARTKAEFGLFNATDRIGHPDTIESPTLKPTSVDGTTN